MAGCDRAATPGGRVVVRGGDADKGRRAFVQFGCGACHTVHGVSTVSPQVGPPLDHIATRPQIAGGVLANTPENMIRWIQDPPAVSPKTTMPNLHIGDDTARDIASYLYTLE